MYTFVLVVAEGVIAPITIIHVTVLTVLPLVYPVTHAITVLAVELLVHTAILQHVNVQDVLATVL